MGMVIYTHFGTEGNGLDTNERGNDKSAHIDKDTRINLVLNNPRGNDDYIDLGHVYQNFKKLKKIYAWVLLLCLVAGICASLLWYQFTEPPLSVSSVVTLDYEIPNPLLDPTKNNKYTPSLLEDETIPRTVQVSDLTAPDGSELDLGQITSSYVLQSAISGLRLSQPVTLANLSSNIKIEKILTEDSRRKQEIAASMLQDKNSSAYEQIQDIKLIYENQFVVTLTNGFGDEDSNVKYYLTSNELHLILDRTLDAYNDYLALTYADNTLPANEFSLINTQTLDLPETLDQLRTSIDNLYDYCNDKSDTVRAYRSWRTGLSLNDLMEHLQQVKRVDVDYLYACILGNGIARNPAAMQMNLQYQLRNAQTDLDHINEKIANTQSLLDGYKNDEILISMQDSDATKSTTAATNYYNRLVLEQAQNYSQATELETTIANLKEKIRQMTENAGQADTQAYDEELERILASCTKCYDRVNSQLKEITTSAFYTTYLEHSSAEGKAVNFIVGAMKKLIIGIFAGLVIGFGIWFLAALLPEFKGKKRETVDGEEAAKQ